MHDFRRELRIIAALMLFGAGLGLLGALVHTESVMYSHTVAKARHVDPASTSSQSHSRHG